MIGRAICTVKRTLGGAWPGLIAAALSLSLENNAKTLRYEQRHLRLEEKAIEQNQQKKEAPPKIQEKEGA